MIAIGAMANNSWPAAGILTPSAGVSVTRLRRKTVKTEIGFRVAWVSPLRVKRNTTGGATVRTTRCWMERIREERTHS